MSKEEIKNLLIEFVCEYDFTNWSNDKVYEKFSDLIYKQISDLEAKLAEKEGKIETLKQRIDSIVKIYSDDFVKKDKELKELRFQARNIFPLVENLEDKVNQDKISFAVEKIQDLKKSLRDKVCLMENDEHCYPQNAIHWQDVVALIDNQIKQLKEMK